MSSRPAWSTRASSRPGSKTTVKSCLETKKYSLLGVAYQISGLSGIYIIVHNCSEITIMNSNKVVLWFGVVRYLTMLRCAALV